MLDEWGWKYVNQQIFPACRTMFFTQLLTATLLSETIVVHAQLAFICLNSAIITVKQSAKCLKLKIEISEQC